MIIHKDSHTDHAIPQAQWHHILDVFEGRTGFFIETIELPQDLGFVLNELYGPSCGDAPVPEAEVHYAPRAPRAWNSRLIKAPKRPTRFIRIIAGPHEAPCGACDGEGRSCLPCEGWGTVKYPCVLYTAYGVSSKDMPTAPKEPGDLLDEIVSNKVTAQAFVTDPTRMRKLEEAQAFWAEHALATEAH